MKLVLLPGMDGTGHLFELFVQALPPALTAQIVSYPVNQCLGYEALTELVRSELPKDEPFALLGESFSGPIAVRIAAEQPAGLAAIVLCCSFVRNPSRLLSLFQPLISVVPFHLKISHLIGAHLLGIGSNAVLRRMIVRAVDEVNSDVLRFRLREIHSVDVSNLMARITVPILYLGGTQDTLVPASCANEVLDLASDAEIVDLAAPHMLLQVAPEPAAREMSQFIARRLGVQ